MPRLGGFLAGLGFMLPGFVLMLALSWLYLSTNMTGRLGRPGMVRRWWGVLRPRLSNAGGGVGAPSG